MIILSLFELLYLLSLHAGIFGSKYGPTYGNGYGNNAAGTGVGGPKAGNYGTPAASAVWKHRIGFINIWTSLIRTSGPSY